jgi:RNA polymerase sigma-70 factor (ECF subfamily)
MEEKNLKLLIKKSQCGDKDAFHYIFEKLNNRLFSYALSRTKNRDVSLDITQDTFIDTWSAMEKFHYNSDEAFYGFIFTILKRKISQHRKNNRTFTVFNDAEEESYEIETEDYRYLFKHIDTLAKKYRDVLRLRYWSDLTFKEISKILDVKEITAKVRHHRAIQKLKINLEKYNHV